MQYNYVSLLLLLFDFLLFLCLLEREMDEKSIDEAISIKFDENLSRQVSA